MIYEESNNQITFIRYCWLKGYPYNLIFSIPNERKTSVQMGRRMNDMGRKAGIPDLFLPYPNNVDGTFYHGLFIEMKSKKGRLTEIQKERHNELREQHYAVRTCYGFEDARNVIDTYLKNKENRKKFEMRPI